MESLTINDSWEMQLKRLLNAIGLDHIPSEKDNYELITGFIKALNRFKRDEIINIIKLELNNKYGDGNNEALVIIEPTLSGVSQRPALQELLKILEALK